MLQRALIVTVIWGLWASSVLIGGTTAELQRVTGEPVRGTLVKLNASGVVMAASPDAPIPWEQITSIAFVADKADESKAGQPTAWMRWTDGSRSAVAAIEIRDDRFHAKLLDRTELEGPTNSVDAVRFYAPAPGTNQQWEELLKRPRTGDVVIVRKSAESLDLLEGVIHSVTADVVEFEFDGQKIPVRRTKLEGVAFAGRRDRPARSLGRLLDRFGGEWQLAKIESDGSMVKLETISGVRWQWRLDRLRRLELQGSNVVYLSDLEPEKVEWTSFFPGGRLSESFRGLFAVQKDRSLSGDPLELVMADGHRRVFAKGLGIHSRTELVYRLTEPFARFHAIAGIDVAHRGRGTLQLTVMGDGRPLWSGTVRGSEPPLVLDVSLRGVRRLALLVDYGDESDAGDHLNLCEPRLVKAR